MLPSVSALCDQYAWLYTNLPAPAGTWSQLIPTDGCYAGVADMAGAPVLMFRGSVTMLDWLDDFDSFAIPHDDSEIGLVHPGAREGVLQVRQVLDTALAGESPLIVGHSLGALHAVVYAAYRRAAGLPIAGLVLFGEPRSGGPRISQLLAGVPSSSWRNGDEHGHDLVTDVPFKLMPLLPYQHLADPLLSCSASPVPNDPWLAFRYHHFGLYCRAMGAKSPQVMSLVGAAAPK